MNGLRRWPAALLALLMTWVLAGCGAGSTEASATAGNGLASAGGVSYQDKTLVVRGSTFGPRDPREFCGDRVSAQRSCYEPARVGLWVHHSDSLAVAAQVYLFGLAIIDRTDHSCGGTDREFWIIGVPGGFELQWLLAMRFFLTVISTFILPAPIAPSDPFSDPATVVGFVCTFANGAGSPTGVSALNLRAQ